MSTSPSPSPGLGVGDVIQLSQSHGDLVVQQATVIGVFLASLKDYIIRMLSGEHQDPMQLRLEPFLHLLDQVSADQLSELYNVTGTSDKLSLLVFLSTNNITVGGELGQPELTQFPEYRLKKQLVLYVSPVLLLLGTLGNLFSFIVLRRKPLVKVSSYIYLASLAVIDTIVLYIGLMRVWLAEVTGLDFQNSGDWICKLSVVLGYMASNLSVWLIIAVTVERYIVVCFPFKASSMCNTNRARKVIAFLAFLMLSINFHFFWTSGLVKNGEHLVCQAAPRFHQLVEEVWPWVDAFIYSFLPFGIIITLNVLIVREVTRARSKRLLMSGSDHAVYGMEPTTRYCGQSNGQLTGQGQVHSTSTARTNQERSKLTVLLLTVSFTFLLLTLPNSISLIITRFWNKRYANDADRVSESDYRRLAQFTLARTITELLMYANHSVNFFLYCATGHKFRQQVLSVMRALCPRANIGRFRHGRRRSRAGRRGDNNEELNLDGEGSSCGGATNVVRFGYSMSVRRTSATHLVGHDGARVSPNIVRHDTDYSAQSHGNGQTARLFPGEDHGGKLSPLKLTSGTCQVPVSESANVGGDGSQLNGRRPAANPPASRTHEHYQMSPLGKANSHQPIGSGVSWSLEINGNKCFEKQTSGISKPFRSVSLFTKRSRGGDDKAKTKQSNGCANSNLSRTDSHSPPSRFKLNRSSNSVGGAKTNKGRNGSASCHGCKLHYYSNKRRKSNPISAGFTGSGDTSACAVRENEYVLLTPEMHWVAPTPTTA